MSANIKGPMYLQIANDIMEKVKNQTYEIYSKIPTEEELSKSFGVSRMTARNAITYLVEKGVLYRLHGSGTYVSSTKIERKLNKLQNFQEEFKILNLETSTKLVKIEVRTALPREQSLLGIKSTNVYYFERIRYVNDIPLGFQKFTVPVNIIPGLEKLDLEKKSFYEYLENEGIKIFKGVQRMESITHSETAEILNLPDNTAFFYIERISYDNTETPFELLECYFRGDMYAYTTTLFR